MSTEELDRSKLPIADPPFKGTIGRTYQESESAWPELPKPPEGAPNVVIIILDDVGFGQAPLAAPYRRPIWTSWRTTS